jgi:hypothetical protein
MTPAAFNVDSSFLTSNLDIVTPLWATKLYQPYDQVDVREMNLLLASSPKETVGNYTGVHYELDRRTTYFQAGALFTVAGADNTQTGPLAASLVNPDGTSAVRVSDILMDSITFQRFRVDSVSTANPPVVELTPLQTGFSTAIPSGRNLVYITRAEKERSGPPAQLVRGTTQYTWQTQMTRATLDISGTAYNLDLKPSVLADGTPIAGWNTIQTLDTEAEILRQMFGAYMFGDSTASAQANLAVTFQTAQGLDKTIQQRGWNLNIGSAAITLANLLTATANIKAQAASEFYEVLMPNKRMNEWNAINTTAQANTNIQMVNKSFEKMFFGSAQNHEALSATYTWSAIELSNIKFAAKELNFLNNPTTFNVDPSTSMFQNLMYFLPVGSTSIELGQGKPVDSKFVTVLNRGKYQDRWMYMKGRGLGFNGGSNDGIDHTAVDYIVDFGYRFAMMNSFGRIY